MIARFGLARKSDGRKTRIRCAHCPRLMRAEGVRRPLPPPQTGTGLYFTWEIDRLHCGHAGGRYRDDNTVPSCPGCNKTRCKVRGCRGSAPPAKLFKTDKPRRAA
jgi:hypothetical protein